MTEKNYSSALTHPAFELIAKEASKLQQEARVIGGWVRDLLIDRPSKDIDVVTKGSGISLAEAVSESMTGNPEIHVFKRFGTAMIKSGDWEIEFVGARKESYREDSRKPTVENGSFEDDQNRRDFTINAMSIELTGNYGQLVDPFNGIQDLENKIIRTPLDADITYSDDPLRMMRAIRFATQLDFEIEEKSFQAIKRNKERLKIISAERIAEELNKIMLSPKPSVGFKLLFETGLLEYIIPEMIALHGVEEINGLKHKDNFYHTLEVVDNISENTNNLWLRYAALLHDIGKPPTKRFSKKNGYSFHGHEFLGAKMVKPIFKRLRLPLDQKMKYVQKLVAMSSRPIAVVGDHVSDSGVRRLLFDAGEDMEDLMMLCEADITTKNPVKQKRYLSNFQRVRLKLKEVEEKDHVRNFEPPVKGEEIMEMLSLEPGRSIGIIKKAIKEAILDGEIENNRDQAIAFMKEKAKELKL